MEIWEIVMSVMLAVAGLIWQLFADEVKAYVVAKLRDFVSRRVSPVWRRYRLWRATRQYNPNAPPILLDEGRLSLMIDRNGKKCRMIGARGLSISHGDNERHWKWTSHTDARFLEVVELLSVYWLEIRGQMSLDMLSPSTTYVIYLVLKFARDSRGLSSPAKATSTILDSNGGKTKGPKCTVHMWDSEHGNETAESYSQQERSDGWIEVKMGEFFVNQKDDRKLHVKFKEANVADEKKGLIIQGIEVRPKQGLFR